MSLPAGTHRLGPDNATLSVRTGRLGAAAKAGHDLLLHVTSWEGELTGGEDPRMRLTADGGSLRVVQGTGGMNPLADEDKASIQQTIDDEVLERRDIAFRSTRVTPDDRTLHVEGELIIGETTRPIAFDLDVGDQIRATAVVTQSDWGIKPYRGLWGALKVKDEVEVSLEGHLAESPQSR